MSAPVPKSDATLGELLMILEGAVVADALRPCAFTNDQRDAARDALTREYMNMARRVAEHAEKRAASRPLPLGSPAYCSSCNDVHPRTAIDPDDLLETLREFEAFFDAQADADTDADGVHPNKALRLLHACKVTIHSVELVQKLASEPCAASPVDYEKQVDALIKRVGIYCGQKGAQIVGNRPDAPDAAWAEVDHARANLLATLHGLRQCIERGKP